VANIRQNIVDALKTRMESITTANGYSATIKTVDDWLLRPLEDDSLPAVTIRDMGDTLPQDGIGAGRRDHELTLFLVVTFSGSSSLTQCRELMADMLTAIGSDPEHLGVAGVYDVAPLNTELIADEANKKVAFGQLVLSVLYRSTLWDM